MSRSVLFVSPGDLAAEHRLLSGIIDTVRTGAVGLANTLGAAAWHDTSSGSGRTPAREAANLQSADLVVMLLWRQWGEPAGRYSSAFRSIFTRAKSQGKDILLYFRDIDDDRLAAPDAGLAKVLAFRDAAERGGGSYFWYENEQAWRDMAVAHLGHWLRSGLPSNPGIDALPDHQRRLAGWMEAIKNAKRQKSTAAFRLAGDAFSYAAQGRFTKACQSFARAVARAPEPYILNEYGIFLKTNGMLKKAERLFERLAQMGQFIEDGLVLGSALRHLGDVCERSDRAAEADMFYKKALALEKGFGRKLKQAALYEGRGRVQLGIGAFDAAEKMFEKALSLYEEMEMTEGQALVCHSLIDLYLQQENAPAAMAMCEKARALFERMGEPRLAEQLRDLNAKLRTITRGR